MNTVWEGDCPEAITNARDVNYGILRFISAITSAVTDTTIKMKNGY